MVLADCKVKLYKKKTDTNNRSCLNLVNYKRTLDYVSRNRKSMPLIVIWHYILFIVQTFVGILLLLREQIRIMFVNNFGEFILHFSLKFMFASRIARHNICLKIKKNKCTALSTYFLLFYMRSKYIIQKCLFFWKVWNLAFHCKRINNDYEYFSRLVLRPRRLVYSYGGIGLLPPSSRSEQSKKGKFGNIVLTEWQGKWNKLDFHTRNLRQS